MTESAFASSFAVDAMTMNARGLALLDGGDLDAALGCFDRALASRPDRAELHHNRGRVLWLRGELEAALASFEQALALEPGRLDCFDGVAQAALHLCDWQRTERIGPQIAQRVAAGEPVSPWLLPGSLSGGLV